MKALIVNADDLGLTPGINEAIRRAHVDGIVGSTSLLAVGRAFDDAVNILRATPTLDVGVHLALVGEDPPLCDDVPSLVDATGAFPLSYRTVVLRGLLGRVRIRDIRREFSAQIERVLDAGIPVTHLDTHQHTHLWPTVGAVVADLAKAYRIPAVRLPRSRSRGVTGLGVGVLGALLRRRLRRAGLRFPLDYAGLDEAGSMTQPVLLSALAGFPCCRGPVEINCHPGLADEAELARFDWGGYAWGAELAALTATSTREAIAAQGFTVVGFDGRRR